MKKNIRKSFKKYIGTYLYLFIILTCLTVWYKTKFLTISELISKKTKTKFIRDNKSTNINYTDNRL